MSNDPTPMPMPMPMPMPQQFSLFNDESQHDVDDDAGETSVPGKYSNFVVYVDESGDHGMQTLDANYPVFVLAFCVFYKRYYSEKVVPALHKFKFNYFGHDLVVLHEHEIQKEKGDFRFFVNRDHKQQFKVRSEVGLQPQTGCNADRYNDAG